jgi:SAM-dependent methyltransferase
MAQADNAKEHSPDESKRIVETGYDQIASEYLKWTTSDSSPRIEYLQKLLKLLPQGSRTLELGCGAGIPATQMLARHSHVTANDISTVQIALARQNIPKANIIQSDMMSLAFPPGNFDAVVALYSIIHLPRVEQEVMVKRISEWLCPGGYLLMNLGTRDDPGSVKEDWLGSRMYWSSFDEKENRDMVQRIGFDFIDVAVINEEEHGKLIPFLWMLAKKRRGVDVAVDVK